MCMAGVSEAIKAALAEGKDSFSIIGPDRRLMVFDITPDVEIKRREDGQQVNQPQYIYTTAQRDISIHDDKRMTT